MILVIFNHIQALYVLVTGRRVHWIGDNNDDMSMRWLIGHMDGLVFFTVKQDDNISSHQFDNRIRISDYEIDTSIREYHSMIEILL